jgi:16S rRNA (guanine527-N7)-methyltransferase
MFESLESELRSGIDRLGLTLSDTQVAGLLDYLALLQKWGSVYNLTALREPQEMLSHHLLDSLAAVKPIRRHSGGGEHSLLDVGSGAGLPGVVVAIACPEVRVDCVDTVSKKSAFIQQVAGALKLPNLRGIHARVEKLSAKYDVVTSRAFASLHDFVELSASSVRSEGGCWLAMKGKPPVEEINALPGNVEVFHVEQLEVPGLNAERCLVWLRPKPSFT